MSYPFYTIGHSKHPLEGFVDLSRSVGVTLVADVRTVPRSRANPQYNRDALPESLAWNQIGYEHFASLGGLRHRDHDLPRSVNALWRNESFHNNTDYAMGDSFQAGLARLVERGRGAARATEGNVRPRCCRD